MSGQTWSKQSNLFFFENEAQQSAVSTVPSKSVLDPLIFFTLLRYNQSFDFLWQEKMGGKKYYKRKYDNYVFYFDNPK